MTTKSDSTSTDQALGREPVNSERSADVRFGAHFGLKSAITALPKSARLPTSKIPQLFKATMPQKRHTQNGSSGSGRREEWSRRT
jgi:hypothetical protein